MTKKHFILLPKAIKTHNELSTNHPLAQLRSELRPEPFTRAQVFTLASFCQSQNAQFDRERFLQACGID